MKTRRWIGLLLAICLLTGCGTGWGVENITNTELQFMEAEPVINYEVPESMPSLLVDQIGYLTDSPKVAVVKNKNLPKTFRVVNADTGKCVLEESVETSILTAGTSKIGYADFSKVTIPGNYYLECDTLGRSYSFAINDEVYWPLFQQMNGLFYGDSSIGIGWQEKNISDNTVKDQAMSVMNLLLAYEMNADFFAADEDANQIPDMLDQISTEILYLLSIQENNGSVTLDAEESIYCAAAFAKYSYQYKAFDSAIATKCLQAADSAWKYVEKSGKKIPDDVLYMAAAELYRASGSNKYREAVNTYLKNNYQTDENDSLYEFYGDVTYISTKQKVDVDVCTSIMKKIMNKAENIATELRDKPFKTLGNEEQNNTEELLWNMVELSVVDTIIANHEYDTLIENHLHYFLGVNGKAECFFQGFGEKEVAVERSINTSYRLTSECILMCGIIMK
ncbi:MAG: glycoside hydrolase family 9 protein [Lachnospiraceae bacterium]|nr:glycoside hydrolase family 9 protein [Lachnospiraceae bacterium]